MANSPAPTEGLSDEEFMKLEAPPPLVETPPPAEPPSAEPPAAEPTPPQEPASPPAAEPAKPGDGVPDSELGDVPPAPAPETPPADTPPAGDAPPAADAPPAEGADAPVNYEEGYKALMAPIRANGQDFTPRSPEDMRRLVQKGLGADKVIEQLAPHRQMIATMTKAGIDKDKLNFAIDLLAGNPAAIRKLMADSKINPLDLDPAESPNYQPSDKSVPDNELRFKDALDSLERQEGGAETIEFINQNFDTASKGILFNDPDALEAIHGHRQTPIYDTIVGELNYQKTLGKIPQGTPFIKAYEAVGNFLRDNGTLARVLQEHHARQGTPVPQPAPAPAAPQQQPVATSVVAPKPTVDNGAAARAAAPTQSGNRPAATIPNYGAMSDEEFEKQAPPPALRA